MEAGTIPVWNDMTQTLTGRVCQEIRRQPKVAGPAMACRVIYCQGEYDGLNVSNPEKQDPQTVMLHQWPPTFWCWSSPTQWNDLRVQSTFPSVEQHLYDSWTSKTILQWYLGAIVLQGRIYATAGYDGKSLLSSIECYDPITDSWKVMTSMGTQHCDGGACLL